MKTAEWQCTVCGATNRKLVADTVTEANDRCVTCGKPHTVRADERPVRWKAEAAA
jgi:hypothetical protein